MRTRLLAVVAFCLASPAYAQSVPSAINHEGLVLDFDGLPFEGDVWLRFSIYDAADGGDALWTEAHEVQLLDGYYQLSLGELSALTEVFDGTERFVGISVDGGREMEPRQKLSTVPYAFVAQNVVGDIEPKTITVGGTLVVDDQGNWVGPAVPGTSPAEVLASMRTVDGSSSGLDADRLDGKDSSQFVSSAAQLLVMLTAADGAGSGIDADRLDGLDSSQFLRSDQAGELAGGLQLGGAITVGALADPPFDCTADNAGAIYFDAGANEFLGCDGSAWGRIAGDGGGGGGGNGGGASQGNAGNDGSGSNEAGIDCESILEVNPDAGTGVYWIDPDEQGPGLPYQAYCDMDGGGWTLLFSAHTHSAGPGVWNLTRDEVTRVGVRFARPDPSANYLMPLQKWADLKSARFASAASGLIVLGDFSLNKNDDYRLNFTPTGNGRLDYHRGKPLTTADDDNDQWGNNCSTYAGSFGWFGACCYMCMASNASGSWSSPSSAPYSPVDWNYNATEWMAWWGKFDRREQTQNAEENARRDCEAHLDADPDSTDGVYWIDMDGDDGEAPFKAYCDMERGGWTMVYANNVEQAGPAQWTLTWDQVTARGKAVSDPQPERNYLMPLQKWGQADELLMLSDTSGTMVLSDFRIQPADNYRWSWTRTNNSGLEYHNGRSLSTIDRDNDAWGSSCSSYAGSFGWFGGCCYMCMSSNQWGTWSRGDRTPWGPTDWNNNATQSLRFFAKFRPVSEVRNSPDAPGTSCQAIKLANPLTKTGYYWVTLDGRVADGVLVECDMERDGGGWTKAFASYADNRSQFEWSLSWNEVTNEGKGMDRSAPYDYQGFLIPLDHWRVFSAGVMRSKASGSVGMLGLSVRRNDGYRLNFLPTADGRLNYHRGRPLSTFDDDNDSWSNNCSVYTGSFGWYGSCCYMCMASSQWGTWSNPRSSPFTPVDWVNRPTDTFEFWLR